MNSSIAAVIVTFNRKKLLIDCLQAICNQTLTPNAIFIIDNLSTDGTAELLFENKYIANLPESNKNINQIVTQNIFTKNELTKTIAINYVLKCKNDGGAGGFYEGMKLAYEAGYDWIWMMDDDGMPEREQLNELITAAQRNNIKYSNALVLDKENHNQLSFRLKTYSKLEDVKNHELIYGAVSNFNGTLISSDVIAKIGFIKKEMFIWGDENEYTNRVRQNGFSIATITKARHYHPAINAKNEPVIPFFKRPVVVVKPNNRSHFFFRNMGYIQSQYGNKKSTTIIFLAYSGYFFFRFKFKDLFLFMKYFYNGYRNNFN